MTCEEFDKLMKNTRTVICDASVSDYLTIENEIVICLFEKHITENNEQ